MAWMTRWAAIAVWTAALTGAGAQASAADYDDSHDEAYVVERAYTQHDVAIALTEQGFVEWDDIDWDDGVWKIDNARRVDGREFDLKLDPVTLAVIWSDRD